jgi:hypothetical protein
MRSEVWPDLPFNQPRLIKSRRKKVFFVSDIIKLRQKEKLKSSDLRNSWDKIKALARVGGLDWLISNCKDMFVLWHS